MADLGVKLTDDRIRALMKRLENVYMGAYKSALKNNETTINKFAKFKESDFPDLTPEELKLKREHYIREVNRTRTVYKNIAAEIADAGNTAANIIQGEMVNIYGLNYDFSAFSVQRQSGLSLAFSTYDKNQLTALVQEQQSPFTKIAYKNLGKDKVIVQRLQNQLIQATMLGESQQKIVRRIKGITGQSVKQAKRVVQTERTRVQSQGRDMAINEAYEMGIEIEKEWNIRGIRTRDAHYELSGETAKEGEKFHNSFGEIEFPGDPNAVGENTINCFCYIKPKVISISPELKRHREKFNQQSFEQYRKRSG